MRFDQPFGATPLDPDESAGLIPALSTQSELNSFEAQNIARALDWVSRSRLIKSKLLETATLTELHRQMFDRTWSWAGTFRRTEKNIGMDPWRIPTELKNLTDDVRTWVQCETYAPDEIALRFHHRLVCIHPFPNGNGRHARLAADLLAEQMGQEPFDWGLGQYASTLELRQAYIHALQEADRHDMASLLSFARIIKGERAPTGGANDG